MDVWFTSDTHWGHGAIMKYCSRPYSSVEEMDEALIANWNEVVAKGDTVYHLGDFSFYAKEVNRQIIQRLNGHIHFIVGNHDKNVPVEMFTWSGHYKKIKIPGSKRSWILCHYPLLTWENAHWGTYHLHGHSHGSVDYLDIDTTRLDVGVDCHNYYPINVDRVKEILSEREYKEIDHHKRD